MIGPYSLPPGFDWREAENGNLILLDGGEHVGTVFRHHASHGWEWRGAGAGECARRFLHSGYPDADAATAALVAAILDGPGSPCWKPPVNRGWQWTKDGGSTFRRTAGGTLSAKPSDGGTWYALVNGRPLPGKYRTLEEAQAAADAAAGGIVAAPAPLPPVQPPAPPPPRNRAAPVTLTPAQSAELAELLDILGVTAAQSLVPALQPPSPTLADLASTLMGALAQHPVAPPSNPQQDNPPMRPTLPTVTLGLPVELTKLRGSHRKDLSAMTKDELTGALRLAGMNLHFAFAAGGAAHGLVGEHMDAPTWKQDAKARVGELCVLIFHLARRANAAGLDWRTLVHGGVRVAAEFCAQRCPGVGVASDWEVTARLLDRTFYDLLNDVARDFAAAVSGAAR